MSSTKDERALVFFHQWIEKGKALDIESQRAQDPSVQRYQRGLICPETQWNDSRLPFKKRGTDLHNMDAAGEQKTITKRQSSGDNTIRTKIRQHKVLSMHQEKSLRAALLTWFNCLNEECKIIASLRSEAHQYISKHMNDALLSLEDDDTKAFATASGMATNATWEDESNLFLFVLSEDFNIVSAARRLVQYWNLRCDVFGDRAWKAMNQTGEGALIRQPDLSVLDTEFVTLLPHDKNDCSVTFINAAPHESRHFTDCYKRCLFYIFSVATENRNSQKTGIVVIFNIVDCSSEFRQDIVSFFHKLISCLPLRVKAIHVLSTEANVSHSNDTFSKLDHTVYIHTSQNMTAMASTLTKFDLTMDGLPRCVGGDWGTSHFNMWQELRCRIEWNIPLGISASAYKNLPAVGKAYVLIEDKRERGRRMNSIHSWRKRARFRIERADLEDKCMTLVREQKRLRNENRSLEVCLKCAQDAVWTLHHSLHPTSGRTIPELGLHPAPLRDRFLARVCPSGFVGGLYGQGNPPAMLAHGGVPSFVAKAPGRNITDLVQPVLPQRPRNGPQYISPGNLYSVQQQSSNFPATTAFKSDCRQFLFGNEPSTFPQFDPLLRSTDHVLRVSYHNQVPPGFVKSTAATHFDQETVGEK